MFESSYLYEHSIVRDIDRHMWNKNIGKVPKFRESTKAKNFLYGPIPKIVLWTQILGY
jgi:hypothetical protein